MSGRIIDIATRRQREEPETGYIHVHRLCGGWLEVIHESRSGDSFGPLRQFEADDLEAAVAHAIKMLPQYRPARLGRIALPISLEPRPGQYILPEGGAA